MTFSVDSVDSVFSVFIFLVAARLHLGISLLFIFFFHKVFPNRQEAIDHFAFRNGLC